MPKAILAYLRSAFLFLFFLIINGSNTKILLDRRALEIALQEDLDDSKDEDCKLYL